MENAPEYLYSSKHYKLATLTHTMTEPIIIMKIAQR